MSAKVDGSKVRIFATRQAAADGARAIGWPVGCVVPVHTRFQAAYALGTGVDLDPNTGLPYLSRERYGELWHDRNDPKQTTNPRTIEPGSHRENAKKLPAGIVQTDPPDEESSLWIGSDLGGRGVGRATWSYLKKKFGSPVDDYWKGHRLYLEVRPFDANGQWLRELEQQFTPDGLRDAERYGVDLMQSEPRVQGFWIDAHLDKYFHQHSGRRDLSVMSLGRYERTQQTPNARRQPVAEGRVRVKATDAQMSLVQIYCDDPAHDDARQSWWPTQVTATEIEFPIDSVDAVADLLTEIANSESDDPGGDRGTWRSATALASKVRALRRHIRGADHTPNASYYVWVLLADGTPKSEGPFGPHPLAAAKQLARIGATEGAHDRAVSVGRDPDSSSFEVVRQYRRGTGERVL